jgi:hypothetical protein
MAGFVGCDATVSVGPPVMFKASGIDQRIAFSERLPMLAHWRRMV